jgi:hypothetical protein
MNAVDTGWVTDEDPAELAKENRKRFSTAIRHCEMVLLSDGSVV